MSAVGNAIRPRAEAVEQVVQALVEQQEVDGEQQRAAVQAAIQCWERECGGAMEPSMLDGFQKTACERIERRKRLPPTMDSILSDLPEITDTGYRLGIHLEGLEGTWHRLWAITCLAVEFEGDVERDEGVQTVRVQFEELLGRKLVPTEWGALVERVRQRYASGHSTGQ
jgi:hypothetical protein